jgi:predicted acyltransferase
MGETDKSSERVIAIDIFRGLTILAMIFVNDVARLRGMPHWLRHMPTEADGMTFVDLVFPAFLFIVGMAIPFAIDRRLQKAGSKWQVWQHVLIRSAGLLILGVLMVNMGSLNPEVTGMSKYIWMLFVFIGAILVWNQYPSAAGNRQRLYLSLRYFGILSLLILAVAYRSGAEGEVHWLKTSWWGILGLIGWAYLVSCGIYLLFRRNLAVLIAAITLLIGMYIGDKTGCLDFLGILKEYLWFGGFIGGHSAITLAGVLVGILFSKDSLFTEPRARIGWSLLFALFLFVFGYFLRPLYGISKNLATPTWCLYSSAICAVIFCILYWLVDLKRIRRWAGFLKPAGQNPLLAYILPSIVYALLGLFHITVLSDYLGSGVVGVIRSLVFTLLMLGSTQWLTRRGIRLHL